MRKRIARGGGRGIYNSTDWLMADIRTSISLFGH